MKKIILILGGLAVLAALAVGALVVITLLRDDDPELLTGAPEIPTQAAGATSGTTPVAGATQPAGASSTPSSAPLAPGVLRFVVDPTQSSATYVVREKLARLPVESDAAGVTQDTPAGDVTGELFLTPQGLAQGNKSTFKVDLDSLKSDEGLRDNFVRNSTLQTRQGNNRYATFVVDSLTGFPTNYVDNTEVSLTLTGQMTIHGVTKPLTFEVKARRVADILTATADTTFNMSDFNITPPNVPSARAFDAVRLQVVLVTKRAAG